MGLGVHAKRQIGGFLNHEYDVTKMAVNKEKESILVFCYFLLTSVIEKTSILRLIIDLKERMLPGSSFAFN